MAAPPLVINVVATPQSEQVLVSWDRAPLADTYDIRYRRTGINAAWLAVNVPTGTSKTVPYLTNGLEYEFQVHARNIDGVSPWTASVVATPVATAATYAAPASVNPQAESGQIRVSWVAGAGVPANARYDYAHSTSASDPTPGSADHTVIEDVPLGTYIIDDLANGTPYYIWARTRSETGPSPWTEASATVTPMLSNGPVAPTIAVTAESQQARVTLTRPSSIVAAEVIGYDVAYSEVTTAPGDIPSGDYVVLSFANPGAHIVTGLVNGTTYNWWARTITSAGHGPWSSPLVAAQPTASLAAAAPTSLAAEAGSGIVALSFTAVSGAIDYDYAFGTSNSFDSAVKVLAPNDISSARFVVTGLTNGTPYYFWVRAVTAKGPGEWTASPVSATPIAASPPVSPRIILVAVSPTVVYFELTEVPGATSYTAQVGTITKTVTEPRGSIDFGSASAYLAGTMVARATNDHGDSADSPSVRFRLFDLPSSFSGTSGNGAADLMWEPDSADDDYDYRYRPYVDSGTNPYEWIEVDHTTITGSSITVPGLSNAIAYEFQVRSRRSIIVSLWTDSLVLTPILPQPAFPTNVAVLPGPLEAVLYWTAAAGADFYDYRYRTESGSWVHLTNEEHPDTTAVVHNLIAGEVYEFQIRARNIGNGASGWTESVEARIRNQILTEPALTELRVTGGIEQSILIALANNMLRDAVLTVTAEPKLPGGEYTYVYPVPDDFVKAIEIKNSASGSREENVLAVPGDPENTGFEIDGDLLYTNIERPLIKYIGYDEDDDMRGSFNLLAELLMAVGLAHKYNRNIPSVNFLSNQFQQHLAPAIQSVISFVNAKLLQFETVENVEEPP